jgi:hypothetical protein
MMTRPTVWLILVIACIAILARIIPGTRTIDDSYITYRYARNILAGNGFVYNPGERVLGTTTPLYTSLLVILGYPTGGVDAPFPVLALIVNAIADGLNCILLYLLGNKFSSSRAGLVTALAWAVAPYSVTFAIGGLETSVFIFLLLSMIYAHLAGKNVHAAGFAAFALLTRPDALIIIGPVILNRIIQIYFRVQKNVLVEVLSFSIPVCAWIVFAILYFGSPLPHSVTAKSLAYRLSDEAALIRLLQHYSTPFMDQLTYGIPAIAIGLVLYPFLSILGSRVVLQKTLSAWPLVAYPWLYFLTYAIANPLIFRWYLTPPLPAYYLLILIGADHLLAKITIRINPAGEQPARRPLLYSGFVSAVILLTPCYLLLCDWKPSPDHGLSMPAPEMAWYKLELLYSQAASIVQDDINQYHLEQPILAAGDVGVLGYSTRTRILDLVGLNSKVTTGYYPLNDQYYVINYAVAPDLIIDQKPQYLVILEVYGRLGLLRDDRFLMEYRLMAKIPSDIYGSDGMLVYKRLGQ